MLHCQNLRMSLKLLPRMIQLSILTQLVYVPLGNLQCHLNGIEWEKPLKVRLMNMVIKILIRFRDEILKNYGNKQGVENKIYLHALQITCALALASVQYILYGSHVFSSFPFLACFRSFIDVIPNKSY